MPSRNDNANHYDPEVVVLRGKGNHIKKQQKRDGNVLERTITSQYPVTIVCIAALF